MVGVDGRFFCPGEPEWRRRTKLRAGRGESTGSGKLNAAESGRIRRVQAPLETAWQGPAMALFALQEQPRTLHNKNFGLFVDDASSRRNPEKVE